MSWIKCTVLFIVGFVIFMFIAVLLTWPFRPTLVGLWRDYDHEDIDMFTVLKNSMSYFRGQKLYKLEGHWAHREFFADMPDGTDVIVAQELPNEDLDIKLRYFDPNDPRELTAVKIMRAPSEYHPYPVLGHWSPVTYPPPKGVICVGMLEADLFTLPWRAYLCDVPEDVSLEYDRAHNSQTLIYFDGVHYIPACAHVYHYKSNDPNLPELAATVDKGRVTSVTGGAEGTDATPYSPPPDTTDDSNSAGSQPKKDGDSGNLALWLFNLFFRK